MKILLWYKKIFEEYLTNKFLKCRERKKWAARIGNADWQPSPYTWPVCVPGCDTQAHKASQQGRLLIFLKSSSSRGKERSACVEQVIYHWVCLPVWYLISQAGSPREADVRDEWTELLISGVRRFTCICSMTMSLILMTSLTSWLIHFGGDSILCPTTSPNDISSVIVIGRRWIRRRGGCAWSLRVLGGQRGMCLPQLSHVRPQQLKCFQPSRHLSC